MFTIAHRIGPGQVAQVMQDHVLVFDLLAQATTATRHWYEVNVVGVLVGALVAGFVALLGPWLNHKRERGSRWDETRRSVYLGFLRALTNVFDCGLSTAGTNPGFAQGVPAEWPEAQAYQDALKRLAEAEDEVRILASPQVACAASVLVTRNRARLQPALEARSAKLAHESLAAGRVAEEREKEWKAERERFIEAIHQELGLSGRK